MRGWRPGPQGRPASPHLLEVYRYAHLLGVEVRMVPTKKGMEPAVTKGIKAMAPRGRKRRKAQLVSLTTTARIAGQPNVIHQLVLWLMRIAGIRIGEVYGLRVSSFIEEEGWGHLLIGAQGGKGHLIRDDDENVQTPGTRRSRRPTRATGSSHFRPPWLR